MTPGEGKAENEGNKQVAPTGGGPCGVEGGEEEGFGAEAEAVEGESGEFGDEGDDGNFEGFRRDGGQRERALSPVE